MTFTGRASSILARKLAASGAYVDDKVFTDNEKVLSGEFGHYFRLTRRELLRYHPPIALQTHHQHAR